jgi:hypothetical protein
LVDRFVPPREAPIAAVVATFTPVVLIVNVAIVLPAGTITAEGTVAAVLLLDKLTDVPPDPAGPLRTTVPVEGLPPTTEAGFTDTELNTAGSTIRVAVGEASLSVAMTITEVLVLTPWVVKPNVALVWPAGIVTEVGVLTTVLALDNVTTAPPVAAGRFNVSVPVDGLPPKTSVGFNVKDTSAGGLIVSVAVHTVPSAAEMTACSCVPTVAVET